MKNDIIFFKPVPKITIWGGDVIKNYFGYDFFPDMVGQCWAFNALGSDANAALNEFKGETLLSLFNEKPELFKSKYTKFPFIISLVGPVDDLSIQVHPDTETGKKMGFGGGKNEGWYFIETPDNYNIVYNHNANNNSELMNYIDNNKWSELIRHLNINSEDAVYIPAGTLHAMRKGAVVYEIQQAVDVTFRFYDYDRVDKNGNRRALQTEQAIECLHYEKAEGKTTPIVEAFNNSELTTYISNESFTVKRLRVNGECSVPFSGYAVATISSGKGSIDGFDVKLGDNVLITAVNKIHSFDGNMEILMTME